MTFEFENVPAATAAAAAERSPVRPAGSVLHTTQNRLREKTFLARHGIPVTPFRAVRSVADLRQAVAELGLPAVLKTADFRIRRQRGRTTSGPRPRGRPPCSSRPAPNGSTRRSSTSIAKSPWSPPAGADGSFAHWGVIENAHRNHILDVSVAPADVSPAVQHEAVEIARGILEQLNVVGVLMRRIFPDPIRQAAGQRTCPPPAQLRPSHDRRQRDQPVRAAVAAVCGLPLGDTRMLRPAAMANLLGDPGRRESRTGSLPLPFRRSNCICTEKPTPGRGGKWGI